MSRSGRLMALDGVPGRSAIFSGKDQHGQPLTGHGHARYLPTDEDGDGRVDHLTIHARGGFAPDELDALGSLCEITHWGGKGRRNRLRVYLLGMGDETDYQPAPLRPSAVWVSATPYIAARYPKGRGRNQTGLAAGCPLVENLVVDLLAQLEAQRPDLAGTVPAAAIEPLWDRDQVFYVAGQWRAEQFKRFRRKADDDGGHRPFGAFRISFPMAVRGPIAIGHSSHFGMGLFMPVSSGLPEGPPC